ncbi:hypothetical protein DEA8626_00904 [Defluviimonas aquaemixtae]|uniref:DUF4156 domain-containing protein n=1 Tax=Albidovulum aquaemixtae TaxID=1542388 RepID=A0A2R8B439_9RHOB|nr:hypothetical protein [Defluviimonas aquaemixtae]SPH17386.1 hypothetical protein DEA8626_00904 [Defluviimonas aquaemixtae]
MRYFILSALALCTLSACARDPGFTGVAGVREATPAEVAQCAYVSDFRMQPGVYGALIEQGIRYSRNRIMADAQTAGANTVVFDPISPGAPVYELHAVAYRC